MDIESDRIEIKGILDEEWTGAPVKIEQVRRSLKLRRVTQIVALIDILFTCIPSLLVLFYLMIALGFLTMLLSGALLILLAPSFAVTLLIGSTCLPCQVSSAIRYSNFWRCCCIIHLILLLLPMGLELQEGVPQGFEFVVIMFMFLIRLVCLIVVGKWAQELKIARFEAEETTIQIAV